MNTAAEIYDLMETTGKSAPDITQSLKKIGGDMQAGAKMIATYSLNEGYQVGKQMGEKIGLLKGMAIGMAIPALIGTGYYLYDKYKAKVALYAHEVDGKEIPDGFKTASSTEAEIASTISCNNCPRDVGDVQNKGGENNADVS
ncbi:MAG: hypothetical protein IKK50_04680 [Ruminiclostridium sp.]|nr:hypothetical protein [Ruminiclostridium sp.]